MHVVVVLVVVAAREDEGEACFCISLVFFASSSSSSSSASSSSFLFLFVCSQNFLSLRAALQTHIQAKIVSIISFLEYHRFLAVCCVRNMTALPKYFSPFFRPAQTHQQNHLLLLPSLPSSILPSFYVRLSTNPSPSKRIRTGTYTHTHKPPPSSLLKHSPHPYSLPPTSPYAWPTPGQSPPS